MDLENKTPSKLMNKVLTSSLNCDSPFRLLPNISTPPSRFTKILNPFEPHLIERLHLPTFSPSVFAQVSTPKTDDKFKWSIDNISRVKPADIDEATLSQHVVDQDPTVESLVQEKIEKFFNEKAIVPSPFNEQVQRMPLIISPVESPKAQHCDEYTQTVLTLPPVLPKHIEDALKPYFTYSCDQQNQETKQNSSLYRQLFEFEEHSVHESIESSPALSTGLSPIQFSPEFNPGTPKRTFESPNDISELRDCTLSPIVGRSPREGRSACRLSFSGHMSLDASLVVPDVNQSLNTTNVEIHSLLPAAEEAMSNSSVNWDMEYKQVSILSKSPVSSPEMVNFSNSNTPHSKIFTSQRKRLSHSFKDEDDDRDVEMEEDENVVPKRSKNRNKSPDDVTDGGYHTDSVNMCDSSMHMFASTPTKYK